MSNMCQFYLLLLLMAIKMSTLLIHAEDNNNNNEINNNGKIVGGEKSPKHYPYQISLQVLTSNKVWQHNCGGSIVSEKCVVTAAHCLAGFKKTSLSIVPGIMKLNEKNILRYMLSDYLIHPNYIQLNTSDIGMMTVEKPFKFSDTIQPISYSDAFINGGIHCTLTGWGYSNIIKFGDIPNDLQRTKIPTITNDECIRRFMNVGKTEICTYSRLFQGACAGDSGGPLALQDGKSLVGIVSYGTSICSIGRPDVFTRVSAFYNWIHEYVMKNQITDCE